MERMHRKLALACLLAAALPVWAAGSAELQFGERAARPLSAQVGQVVEVDVDLANSPGFEVITAGDHLEARYRMGFNQIAEGWSWQPLADPAVEDYYRFSFLPLQSVDEARGSYTGEDKIGEPQAMAVRWRYDYFLAFANLHDFYPRVPDDDAGFSAHLPLALNGHVGMRARGRLIEPVISESTTFWKATHARPVDFTLKKRYLVSDLLEIAFVDTDSGQTLCTIRSGQDRCVAH